MLPRKLYETVAVIHEIAGPSKCGIATTAISTTTTNISCDVFGLEVIAFKANFLKLESANSLTFTIEDLANPNIEHTCTSGDLNRFDIKLFDWNSNDLLFITSPSIDDLNCVNFSKTRFFANAFGPLTVSPGLAYTYSLNLERGADNLFITPSASISNSIAFNPNQIALYNYTDTVITFTIKYRADLNAGTTYNIMFDLSDSATKTGLISTTSASAAS